MRLLLARTSRAVPSGPERARAEGVRIFSQFLEYRYPYLKGASASSFDTMTYFVEPSVRQHKIQKIHHTPPDSTSDDPGEYICVESSQYALQNCTKLEVSRNDKDLPSRQSYAPNPSEPIRHTSATSNLRLSPPRRFYRTFWRAMARKVLAWTCSKVDA